MSSVVLRVVLSSSLVEKPSIFDSSCSRTDLGCPCLEVSTRQNRDFRNLGVSKERGGIFEVCSFKKGCLVAVSFRPGLDWGTSKAGFAWSSPGKTLRIGTAERTGGRRLIPRRGRREWREHAECGSGDRRSGFHRQPPDRTTGT